MKTNLRATLSFASTTLLLVLAACGGSQEGGSNKASGGTLTTCTDFTNPPFSYVDGAEQKGSDPDIMRALTKRMGTSLTMKDTRFSSLIIGLKADRCDAVVSFLYVNPERAKIVDFIGYAESGSGFLVKKDGDFQPQSIEDLCGHRVAVLQGGTQDVNAGKAKEECATKGEELTVRSLPTDVAAVQDLIAGRVDTFYSDNATVVFRAKEFAKENLAPSNDALFDPVVGGVAVKKGNTELAAKIRKALDELTKSGELERILSTYGLRPVSQENFEKALKG